MTTPATRPNPPNDAPALPARVAVRMSWTSLLFAHWRVPAEGVRARLPEGLVVDTFDGSAWIGLVPFRMTDCRFAGFGWVPGLSNFYECNVRTYVRAGERRGVWFYSLDAEHLPAVLGGRWMWNLNYVYSGFRVRETQDAVSYRLRRRPGPWAKAKTRIDWCIGDRRPTHEPGSLEHFLTERYSLFTQRRGGLFVGRIHHPPWPLREAEVHELDDGLLAAAGFGDVTGPPESVLAADRIDVIGEPLTPVAGVLGGGGI